MTAKRYQDYFRRVAWWYEGLRNITQCYMAEKKAGVSKFTEDEQEKLREAEGKLVEAAELYEAVWEARIGRAVVKELKAKAYR